MNFLGIDWVGITPENGRKLLLSVVFVFVVLITSRVCALWSASCWGEQTPPASKADSGPGKASAC